MPNHISGHELRKFQNPAFDKESVQRMSWTQIEVGKYPHGRRPLCCARRLTPGQIAVTFPLVVANELIGTAIVHKTCLKAFLAVVPDEREVVLGHWQTIREKHTRKSSKNGTA